MSFELNGNRITANPDFNGTDRKASAVFMMDLIAPGGMGNMSPRNGEEVTVEFAPDVRPETIEVLAKTADFIVRHS